MARLESTLATIGQAQPETEPATNCGSMLLATFAAWKNARRSTGTPSFVIARDGEPRRRPSCLAGARITADTTNAEDLFARRAERMLDRQRAVRLHQRFHFDAVSSDVALNVDVDITLTVTAG